MVCHMMKTSTCLISYQRDPTYQLETLIHPGKNIYITLIDMKYHKISKSTK